MCTGLPRSLSGKESACQCRKCKFDPWVGKIPWRRKWLPAPVFLPGKSHGQRSLAGYSPRDLKRVGHNWASLVAQTVKRLPAMWETWVLFLGQEDPLEKEMAIHSSTLAWKIPWTQEPDRL